MGTGWVMVQMGEGVGSGEGSGLVQVGGGVWFRWGGGQFRLDEAWFRWGEVGSGSWGKWFGSGEGDGGGKGHREERDELRGRAGCKGTKGQTLEWGGEGFVANGIIF